jgi:hypothetical protein
VNLYRRKDKESYRERQVCKESIRKKMKERLKELDRQRESERERQRERERDRDRETKKDPLSSQIAPKYSCLYIIYYHFLSFFSHPTAVYNTE